MFEKLFLKEQPKQDDMINISIGNSPFFNEGLVNDMAKDDFRKCSIQEIYEALKYSYSFVFNDIGCNHKTRFVNAFKNIKFLKACTMFFQDNTNITDGYRIQCNRLIYDIVFNPSHYNADLASAAEDFAYIVNKQKIDKIVNTLGETKRNATLIVIARYFSSNERDNVHFLNWFLINSLKENVEKKYIVYLYGILFDGIAILFTDIMCSSITKDNPDERYIKICNLLADAVFDILDTQPMNIIIGVLSLYDADIRVLGTKVHPRCSIPELCVKYKRIEYAYNYLKTGELVDVI